jgi:hypothetical protein
VNADQHPELAVAAKALDRLRDPFDYRRRRADNDSMELSELNHDERVALVALLEMLVAADGDVSREELKEIKHAIHALGEDAYRAAVAEADASFATDDAARAFLLTIHRPEARELIYECALEAAMSNTITPRESQLLTWLAEKWSVPVRFVGPESTRDAGDDES